MGAKIVPNLFVVGQPKCGTSALHVYLSSHPDIFMSRVKEPHFFCDDFHGSSDMYHRGAYFPYRTMGEYLSLFRKVERESIIGESSTNYLYSKNAARNIAAMNPEARIIILLRNPVDFMYSWYYQCLASEGEDADSFELALDLEEERKRGRMIPQTVTVPEYLFYRYRTRYSEQIERYLDVFPMEQIKIVLYEDFRRDNKGVFLDILKFLGVANWWPGTGLRVNEPKEVRSRLLLDFIMYSHTRHFVKRMFPLKLRQRLNFAKRVEPLLFRYKVRSGLDDRLRKVLCQEANSEVVRVSKILKVNLRKVWDC